MKKLIWIVNNVLPNLFIGAVLVLFLIDYEKALELRVAILFAMGMIPLALLQIWAGIRQRKPKAKGYIHAGYRLDLDYRPPGHEDEVEYIVSDENHREMRK